MLLPAWLQTWANASDLIVSRGGGCAPAPVELAQVAHHPHPLERARPAPHAGWRPPARSRWATCPCAIAVRLLQCDAPHRLACDVPRRLKRSARAPGRVRESMTSTSTTFSGNGLTVYFQSRRAHIEADLTTHLCDFIAGTEHTLDCAIYDLREPKVLQALSTLVKSGKR